MRTFKATLTAIIGIICLINTEAQVNSTDSIDKALKLARNDTAKVNLLIKTGRTYFYTLHDKAFGYFQQAINLSKEIGYPYGLARAYFGTGTYYLDIKSDAKTGLRYYQLADSIFQQYDGLRFKEGLGAVLCNSGALQHQLGNYLEAVQLYIKASKIFESLNNKIYLSRANANLSDLYSYLEQYDKAEYYARQVIKIAEETDNLYYNSLGRITLASSLLDQEKYKEVLSNISKAKKIAEMRNDKKLLSACLAVLGKYYGYYKKDYPQAIKTMKKAIELEKALGSLFGEAEKEAYAGEFYFNNKQFNESKISTLRAYKISHTFKFNDVEQSSLNVLAQAEAHFGDYQKAYTHLLASTKLKDSVFKDKNQRQINYLGALYQSEKKEKEIGRLQSEKQISVLTLKRRNIVIYALFVIITLLVGISFLFFRNIHNKRIIVEQDLEIERQKVKELEKDRQIHAAHAVLEGEEKERGRLSRDLHDGLGGMLSVVKSNLKNLKGNHILSEKNVNHFDHAIALLDDSIKELRRVSHNMMPEALIKFGLKDSLQDFCDQLSINENIKLTFNFIGEHRRLENSLEITLYRIAQELLNNALKHAKATEILIQIVQEDNRIYLTVMDNGIGFNPSEINTLKSAGLQNIRARVESFKGQFDINSQSGIGTEIGIEFELV